MADLQSKIEDKEDRLNFQPISSNHGHGGGLLGRPYPCSGSSGGIMSMIKTPEHWEIPFMDFVDDFRRYKNTSFLREPFTLDNERIDALLASTVEYLCDEMGLEIPEWIEDVPGCKGPWFVAGNEDLKAIAIVESPLRFRMRKIFVLENFLYRV